LHSHSRPLSVAPTKVGSINISFVQDSQLGTKLKFVVHIGPHYNPEDIVVKANMNGGKIRVMATRVEARVDGCHQIHQFNERYALPMDIDPFSVEAKLDSRGDLVVEAPLMTLARRDKLVKEGHPRSSSKS